MYEQSLYRCKGPVNDKYKGLHGCGRAIPKESFMDLCNFCQVKWIERGFQLWSGFHHVYDYCESMEWIRHKKAEVKKEVNIIMVQNTLGFGK